MFERRTIDGNIPSCIGLLGMLSVGCANDSGDYMQATRMAFETKEAAIAFAEKQGYRFVDDADCRVGVLHSGTAQQAVQAQGVCNKLRLLYVILLLY